MYSKKRKWLYELVRRIGKKEKRIITQEIIETAIVLKNLASVILGEAARAVTNLTMRESIILRLAKKSGLVGANHKNNSNKHQTPNTKQQTTNSKHVTRKKNEMTQKKSNKNTQHLFLRRMQIRIDTENGKHCSVFGGKAQEMNRLILNTAYPVPYLSLVCS